MSSYIILTQNEDCTWTNCGEGPWNTFDEAQHFAATEVGVPYRIEEVSQ